MEEKKENLEEGIITVENEGGKGNPNHSKKDGKFVSADDVSSPMVEDDEMGPIELKADIDETENKPDSPAKIRMLAFLKAKREKATKEALEFSSKIENSIPNDLKEDINSFSREEKVAFLYDSAIGYDKKKINRATDEELNALLYAEAVKNRKNILQQDINLLEEEKNNLNKEIEEKLSQNDIDSFGGIWYGKTVHPSNWKELSESGSINKKREYYKAVLANSDSPMGEKLKATQFLKQLDKFEVLGKEYEELKSQIYSENLDKITNLEDKISEKQQELNNFDNDSPLIQLSNEYIDKFVDRNSAYSKERKDKAVWITDSWIYSQGWHDLDVSEASVKYFGPRFEKMWAKMTPEERAQLIDYTGGGYSKYNKPLRNLSHPGWEGWSFAKGVEQLTNAIDKCVWDEDIWVQRGIHDSKIFKMPGSNENISLSGLTDKQLQSLVGTSFKDNGFYSAGAAKGTGFAGNIIIFNTYCPKGTKMAYMNTKGHYKNSYENEMILQRGYEYRITKVEKKGNRFFIDCEVILDSDSDKITDVEKLKKMAKKYLG